jgi:transposase
VWEPVRIELSKVERERLEGMTRSRTLPSRLVLRARIVLLAAEGLSNRAIGMDLGIDFKSAMRWRNRFLAERFDGIERERPGRGRKAVIQAEAVQEVVQSTLQTKPEGATHWSVRSMAKVSGLGKSTIHRIWKSHGLKPHRVESFKLSTDPDFEAKLVDIVGLYLNPPEHAIVLCADEKSQIQALDRTQPGLPMKPGRCGTMTHDYKRNGTTTLFAAMSTLDGKVIGECMPRHRHQEWLRFLKLINRKTPKTLDLHIICDNYRTHKHEEVRKWLEKHPRFHIHFTPTSSSWLNMVERYFRDITENQIRRGVFRSVEELERTIQAAIEQHNEAPRPYIWTAGAKDILAKVIRARTASNDPRFSGTLH